MGRRWITKRSDGCQIRTREAMAANVSLSRVRKTTIVVATGPPETVDVL